MPHHEHEVEVFDADTGAHLGTATLADQASAEEIAALRRTRARKARQLRADLSAAEKSRRGRYAATTTPAPAPRLDAITAAEAGAELAEHGLDDMVTSENDSGPDHTERTKDDAEQFQSAADHNRDGASATSGSAQRAQSTADRAEHRQQH